MAFNCCRHCHGGRDSSSIGEHRWKGRPWCQWRRKKSLDLFGRTFCWLGLVGRIQGHAENLVLRVWTPGAPVGLGEIEEILLEVTPYDLERVHMDRYNVGA